MKTLLELLIEKKRITQWLVTILIGVICIVGICEDFFTSGEVMDIIMYGLLGILGLDVISRGEK